ncbi:MAG: glycosyltransferase family 39 protein [Ginsengibacter sp.]
MKQIKFIWVLIFIIGSFLRSTELFHPIDTESWRESDMAAISKNFYQHGMDIFHPQIAWDGSGPGYTESEFQVYTYLIAISYKIFGVWEPTGRIISFLFSLLTMLIFFRFCRYLFDSRAALACSAFFALSPMLMVISNTIQPDSVMFFFYVGSAYYFLRWIDNQSKRDYFLAILFTSLGILCKLTAANIGIMFVLFIIYKKSWRFLLKPKVLLFGLLSLLPSIIWYSYCHQFYLHYGNSLGISNEYAWVGWDFFTNRSFIHGIYINELFNVWTRPGRIIVLLAIVFTKLIKKESTIISVFWLIACAVFYVIAMRTTSADWAFYYHIFSVPAASVLLGSSVVELYNKYSPLLYLKRKTTIDRLNFIKSILIIFFLALSVSYFVIDSIKYLNQSHSKYAVFQTSPFYSCKKILSEKIPPGSLILASGGVCKNGAGYPVAYNASYFFYWLDMKGYNICTADQSFENIISFKKKGVSFYIAEEKSLKQKPGLESELRERLKTVLECNGIILFKL